LIETAPEDEDAFLSALDGLEDDILGDAELSDFSEPNISQAEKPVVVQPAAAAVAEVQVAKAFEPFTDLDATFDDSIFEDAHEATPNSYASADAKTEDHLFEEPEFEDIDFDLPMEAAPETHHSDVVEASKVSQSAIAATTIAGGGLATILGSMRANASRETHASAGELPGMALSIPQKPSANTELLFPNTTTPYDDVPVTGSLKVPHFVAAEDNLRQSSPDFDGFEIDDIKSIGSYHPASSSSSHSTSLPDINANQQIRTTSSPALPDQTAAETLDDVDFGNAFDEDFSPTDELADLVGSNVEPDPLLAAAKNDDFAPMPAMPSMVAARPARGKWIAFGALGLAIVGALAVYGSSGNNVDSNAEPAIVRADNEPVRVAPENPGGTVVPNQDRVVFNEVGSGSAVVEKPQEALVDGRQEPAIAATPVKEEDRVLNGDNSSESANPEVAAVAPRSVQTVTVRPDGTLVANPPAEPAAAAPQAEVVPETRPEPAAAQPMPEPTNPIAEIAAASVPQTAVAETPAPQASVAVAPVTEVPVAQEPVTGETIAAKVPAKPVETKVVVQKQKAKTQNAEAKALDAVNVVNGDASTATQKAAAGEPAPQADALAAGIYAIQIASTPSEEAATSTLRSLSAKFGSVLGGKDYAIQRAEVPGKGTVYRVRILAGSKADASKLCSRYKSAGGSCFVTR
jgi:SPOR domain